MYRAVPSDVKEESFRNGDWVTPSRMYAEHHIELQDWKGGRIIEQEVPVDDVWWNGDDINEWGYDDGKEYAYKNTKNNRKLLEPVTYDDNGNIIPLSERFNSEKADIRFSKDNANQEIFVSNAEQAVKGIPMEKATPQQFKKWFGDWEIVARANAIRNLTPVDVSKYSMTGTPEESYKLLSNATNKIDGTKVKFDRDVFTMYSLRTSTYTKNPSSMLRLPIQTLGRGWSMEGFPKQS